MGSKKHHKKWKIYVNDTCVCGSGKKYKRCCMDKDAKVTGKSFYETIIEGFKKGELVSFQRIQGDKGSLEISNQSVTFGEEMYSYDKPIKFSIGDSEDGNSSGQAMSTVSMDGKNEITTTQIDSGRVFVEGEHKYSIGIKNKIKEEVNSEWYIEINLKNSPVDHFDLKLINRSRQRDHIKDPHISFRPDGSGRYIRFGDYSKVSKIKTLSESNIHGLLLPISTEVKFGDVTIIIDYLFEESLLCIDSVEIK